MVRDLNQVIVDAAEKVAVDFNAHWDNFQLDVSEYKQELIRAVESILKYEHEHSLVKAQIQNNVQNVIEELTRWIMENEVKPDASKA